MSFRSSLLAAVILCAAFAFLCGCASTTPSSSAAPGGAATQQVAPGGKAPAFTLQVDGLAPGAALPASYTCTGPGGSPAISWTNVPEAAKSLVLVLDDPDAPRGTFTHWIVYNIPPSATGIPPAVTPERELPGGGTQGLNSRGTAGYTPPCPPAGSPHRYIFQLYAVDSLIDAPAANRDAIGEALKGHVVGEAQVVTIFGR